jgi:outer membrane protein insertion porin family
VNSVRGYQTSNIGPRDFEPLSGRSFAIGGTKKFVGNAELYFPIPGMKDNKQLRLSAFVDAGTVYGPDDSVDFSLLRYSTGLGVSWYSPFGPIKLVVAKPLNEQQGDRTQMLQFQFGQQF